MIVMKDGNTVRVNDSYGLRLLAFGKAMPAPCKPAKKQKKPAKADLPTEETPGVS